MELLRDVVVASREVLLAAAREAGADNLRLHLADAARFSFQTNGRADCNRAAVPTQIPQPPDPDALDPTPRVRPNPPVPPDPTRSAPKGAGFRAAGQVADAEPLSWLLAETPSQARQVEHCRQIDPGEVRRIVREVLAENAEVPAKVDAALQVDLPSTEEQPSFFLSGLTERLLPVLLPLRECCSTSMATKRKSDVVALDQAGDMKAGGPEEKEQKAGTCAFGMCSAGALAAGGGSSVGVATPCSCACLAGACARLGAKARWIDQESPTSRLVDMEPLFAVPEDALTPPRYLTSSDPEAMVRESAIWRPLQQHLPRAEILRPVALHQETPNAVLRSSMQAALVPVVAEQGGLKSSFVHGAVRSSSPPVASLVAGTNTPRLYGRKVQEFGKVSRV